MEHNNNGDRCMGDTYGFFCSVFDAQMVRIEVASGQARSTGLGSTDGHAPQVFCHFFWRHFLFVLRVPHPHTDMEIPGVLMVKTLSRDANSSVFKCATW